MERLNQLQNILTSGTNSISEVKSKSPDDVVICSALRTANGKGFRGHFKDTQSEIMQSEVLKAIVKQAKIDPAQVEDLVVGNVLQPGAAAMIARTAQLMAGFPVKTTAASINRLCSSGIESCAIIAGKIKSGIIDIGIGAGVESMSAYSLKEGRYPKSMGKDAFLHQKVRDMYIPDGITSENVSERFGQTRKDLDEFAVLSHKKASEAQKNGLFKSEIVPVKVSVKGKDGKVKTYVADFDDGVRSDSNVEKLAKLKPAFKKDGLSTGGNASQISDGAAGVQLARRSVAEKLKLPILAKFVAYSTAGCEPEVMGIGPIFAIPKCLAKAGVSQDQVDIFELNEAFASQASYCAKKLNIPMSKVNPKGGSIALGHPLASTGARMMATLIPELKRTGKKYGVISMCVGTGMGACALVENE